MRFTISDGDGHADADGHGGDGDGDHDGDGDAQGLTLTKVPVFVPHITSAANRELYDVHPPGVEPVLQPGTLAVGSMWE